MSKQAKELKKEQKKAEDKAAKLKPKKVSRIKAKKKSWFKIIGPKVFGHKEVGESYLSKADSALGRTLQINLRELTGNVRDQNVHIGLQINKLNGNQLNTTVISYQLSPSYIKRLVRKNTSRLDDYFKLTTKGGKKVVLKSLVVTLSKTQRSTRTQLRKELGKIFQEEVSQNSFDGLVDDLVHYKVQSAIKKRLRRIFPLKEAAVRELKLIEKDFTEETILENRVDKAEELVEDKAAAAEEAAPEAEDMSSEMVTETDAANPQEEITQSNEV